VHLEEDGPFRVLLDVSRTGLELALVGWHTDKGTQARRAHTK
jgi:hypothetical protein